MTSPSPDGVAAGSLPELSIAWGGPPAPVPAPADSLLESFDVWVSKQPDAVAVSDVHGDWTYAELDAVARRTADHLRTEIGRGDLVGVLLDRSPALVATAVALARLHAVYFPLGAAPARARHRELIEDNHVACLITAATATPFPEWDTIAVTGPDFPGEPLVASFRPQHAPAIEAADAFSAVTTSGTTGKPKVVLLSRSALEILVRWYCRLHELGSGDRVSLLAGTTFDAHQMEMWSALSAGATLYVAPDEARISAARLLQWWTTAGITSAFLPTPLAELALARQWPADLALRHLTVGGDRMRTRPPAEVATRVHNVYGPTEATVVTTSHTLQPDAPHDSPISIGLPRDGVTVVIADAQGRPVPRGDAGEVLIGGSALAIGYTDSVRTAERFFVATQAGPDRAPGRVYRTGDRALMDEHGRLTFLGRLDDQVKISGVRIEPVEVEAALENHPDVRNAVVVSLAAADGNLLLAAYVQLVEGASRETGELLGFVRERVVPQAVPAHLHVIDEFPLNANGKVDRSALAARHPTAVAVPGADAVGTEGRVLAICRRLLDLPDLELYDNFADSGGTSLAIAQLLAAVESQFGVSLRAAQAMRQPDIRALARLIDEATPFDSRPR